MPNAEKWKELITEARAQRVAPLRAITYIDTRTSASKPVKLSVASGAVYFVKGGHCQRQLVNDQIIGRLGMSLQAPTATVAHIDVVDALVAAEPMLDRQFPASGRFQPGVWHGSLVIDGVSNDRENIVHFDVPENRPRFALLAVLFGWGLGSDHQFLYANQHPPVVYSCDHGHFFPNGPDWTIASLTAAPAATPDQTLVSTCSITPAELRVASGALEALDPEPAISSALGNVLDHWGVTLDELVALAQYLTVRREQIISHIAQL